MGEGPPCLAPRVFFVRLFDLISYGANLPLRTTASSTDDDDEDEALSRSTWTISRLRSLRRKRGMAELISAGEDADADGSSTGLGLDSDESSSPTLLEASRLGAVVSAGAALNNRRRLRARRALGVPSSSSTTPVEPDEVCMSSQLRGLLAGLEPWTRGGVATDF